MLRMKPITIDSWPFIGFSAKTGEMEKGAILKEKEVVKQAKELVPLLIRKIRK
ncbi:MAG: hypothetical protein QXL57_08790 [Candidatus Bathyarchaeia archaeon]